MIPPSFSDLGKAAKDLFDKKFKFGLLGLDCTTSSEPINVKIEGTHDLKTKVLSGSFESKHSGPYDIDVTTKWNTKNVLTTEIAKSPLWIKSLKGTAVFAFEPDTGKRSLKLKQNYKRDLLNFNGEVFFTTAKPSVNLNVVLGCTEPRNYFAGLDILLNTNTCSLAKHTLALSYQKHDFSVVGSVQNLSLFSTLVHQRVTDHTEVGVNISYNKQNHELKYGLAGRYSVPGSSHSFLKAKIDQSSRVGLVYGTRVSDGVELSICGEVDARNFEAGPHNIGLGVLYEP